MKSLTNLFPYGTQFVPSNGLILLRHFLFIPLLTPPYASSFLQIFLPRSLALFDPRGFCLDKPTGLPPPKTPARNPGHPDALFLFAFPCALDSDERPV